MGDSFSGSYILDEDGQPQPCPDPLAWAQWMERTGEDGSRWVNRDEVGLLLVSTVFLGRDMNWSGEGDPILWETAVIGPAADDVRYIQRYTSREAAAEGHAHILGLVRLDADMYLHEG